MRRLFFCSILAFIFGISVSSQINVDSLSTLLNEEIPDSVQVDILKELGEHYINVDTTLFKRYVYQLLKLGQDKSIETAILSGYNQLGNWAQNRGKYDEAILYYKQAISEASDSANIARLYGGIGAAHYYQSKLDSSEFYMLRGFQIKQRTEPKDSISLGVSLFNLATMAEFQNRYDRALEYYHQTESYFKSGAQPRRLAVLYNNMGAAYSELGNEKRQIEYLEKAYELGKSIPHLRVWGNSATNLAKYYNTDYPTRAEELHLEAIQALTELGQQYNLARSLNSYSIFLIENDRFQEAKPYLKRAIDISTETADTVILIDCYSSLLDFGKKSESSNRLEEYASKLSLLSKDYDHLESRAKSSRSLMQYYEFKNDPKKALQYFKLSSVYQDSIRKGRFNKVVKDLEIQYATKEKEALIAKQEKEIISRTNEKNYYRTVMLFSSLLLGLIFLALFQYRRITKSKIENLENQQKLMALDYMVQGQENERRRIAQDLHDGLGGILSTAKLQIAKVNEELDKLSQLDVVSQAQNMIDRAHNEVRRISHDMMPGALIDLGLVAAVEDLVESVGNSNNFKISIIDHTDDFQLTEIQKVQLYRTIQELVNNIVKHSEANKVEITFDKTEDQYEIIVADNGIGFDFNSSKQKGLGLTSIENRIKYLNGDVKFSNSEPGVLVKVSVPI